MNQSRNGMPGTPSLAEASYMSIEETPGGEGNGGGSLGGYVTVDISPSAAADGGDNKKRCLSKSGRAGVKRQRVMEHAATIIKLASDLKARIAHQQSSSSSPLKPGRSLDEELRQEAVHQANADLLALENVWSESSTKSPTDFAEYRDSLLRFADKCSIEEFSLKARTLAAAVDKAGRILEIQSKAEMCKLRGNEFYSAGLYGRAQEEYQQAVNLDPRSAVFAANRAAALLMLGRFTEALSECERAIKLDKTYLRAYLRGARASLSLGDATDALTKLDKISTEATKRVSGEETTKILGEANELIRLAHLYLGLIHKADGALVAEDAMAAMQASTEAVLLAPASTRIKAIQASARLIALAIGGADPETCSNALQNALMEVYPCSCSDLYRYAMILFRRALRSEATVFLNLAQTKSPTDTRITHALQTVRDIDIKLREGARLQAEGRLGDALAVLNAALLLDPTNDALNGRILYQRAGINVLAGRTGDAEEDCRRSLLRIPKYQKARLRLSKCLIGLGRANEAMMELNKIQQPLNGVRLQSEYQQLKSMCLKEAEREKGNKQQQRSTEEENRNRSNVFSESRRRGLYEILGVNRNASKDEIRKAYKKGALRLHPDKNLGKSTEEDFKRLVEAFEVLSSPNKRRTYDLGCGDATDMNRR